MPGRFEATLDRARSRYLPRLNRLGDALERLGAERAALEGASCQLVGALRDDDGVGLGDALQPGGDVRRLADHGAFP